MKDYTTDPGAKARFTRALRDLAGYLDRNPAIPVPKTGETITVHASPAGDGGRAQVDHIAALLDASIRDETARGGGPPLPWTVTTLGSLGTGGTPMVTKYQKFGDGYKAEAVKLYRESNQTIAETARNLGLKESTLANWVKKDKENEAVAVGEAPLTPAERTRIRELEADVRRLNMENAFLKKASAYFASQNL